LGQHFLTDGDVLDRIVEVCALGSDDTVVEIGAGLGALTTRLAQRAKTVLALEKDNKLVALLRSKIVTAKNVTIIHQDAFYFDYRWAAAEAGMQLKVVGNLPYNIASSLTVDLVKRSDCIRHMVLMYQKEVAERLSAQPGTKEYGVLTVLANLYSDIVPLLSVSREAFYPRPKVESALLGFTLLPRPREELENEKLFLEVVKSSFSQHRKKLRNALKSLSVVAPGSRSWEELLGGIGIDPDRRGETLSLGEFARLSNRVFDLLDHFESQ
jgi:16S rRNA (adenine1518-N6/adenine1519-N6)-dimethyltransferase